jgi:3-dehydroquinate dehydratase-2
MKITIINGPNLNLLGIRETDIYGDTSFEDYFLELIQAFPEFEISYFQSNIEGELIDRIQIDGFSQEGIILNAGGYTHTSVAIADAVRAVDTPIIEVHISNIYSREEYRNTSLIAPYARGTVTGLGFDSYRLAMEYFRNLLK